MLTDIEARNIASEWHSGGDPLGVFSSTGAIVEGLQPLVKTCFESAFSSSSFTNQDVADLRNLGEYVKAKGQRGPVEGWGNLPW